MGGGGRERQSRHFSYKPAGWEFCNFGPMSDFFYWRSFKKKLFFQLLSQSKELFLYRGKAMLLNSFQSTVSSKRKYEPLHLSTRLFFPNLRLQINILMLHVLIIIDVVVLLLLLFEKFVCCPSPDSDPENWYLITNATDSANSLWMFTH